MKIRTIPQRYDALSEVKETICFLGSHSIHVPVRQILEELHTAEREIHALRVSSTD